MQMIILNIEQAFTLDILSIAMIVGFDLLAFIEVVLTKELYK